MTENFGDADNREIFCVDDELAPGGAHFLAADAEEFRFGITRWVCGAPLHGTSVDARFHAFRKKLAQGLQQLCAVHLAGGLACRNQYSHASILKAGVSERCFAISFRVITI